MRSYLKFHFGGEVRDLKIKCSEEQHKFLVELLENLNKEIGTPNEAGFELFDVGHCLLVDAEVPTTELERVGDLVDFTEL